LRPNYPDLPPNPPLDPQSEQQRQFESIVALCSALAAQNPLLLVIEDVQWADYGSLSLLRHLARRCHNAQSPLPLLIVMTYRDIELEEGQALNEVLFDLTRERLATRIKLGRFDKEQTRQFLEVMFQQENAGDVHAQEFLDALYRETEGNMFYVEEVCRALVEEGVIYLEDGRWRLPDDIAGIQLPQSVRLAVQARLNKLPPNTQEALRVAALIGREFNFQILQQASEMDEEVLVEALEAAERAQLISEASALPRRGEGETFIFSHGLTLSTLREGISGLRRRRLHRRIAIAIEAHDKDDYEALAFHYLEAGDEEHALAYYRRAGDRARLLYANQEAIRAYSQALAILADENSPDFRNQKFELLAARTVVFNLVAQREAEKGDVTAMLAIAESAGDPSLLCDANLAWANYLLATNSHEARQPAEKAASLARQLGEPGREGNALHIIGQVDHYANNDVAARQALETAIVLLRRAEKPAEAAACLNLLCLVLQDLHEDDASLQAVQEALELSRKSGNRRQEAISLRRLAIYYENHSRMQEALPVAEEALRLHRELGDRSQECHALNLLGIIQAQIGRHDEAEQTLRQALEAAWDIQMSEAIQYIAGNLVGLCYYRQGEHEQGLIFINEQIARLRKAGFETAADLLQITRMGVLYDLAQYAAALVDNQAMEETGKRLGSLSLQARARGITGTLYAEMNDYPRAYEYIQSALVIQEQGNQSVERAELLSRLAYVYFLNGGQEHLLEGLECAQKALELYPTTGVTKPFDCANTLVTLAAIQVSLGRVEAALQNSTLAIETLKENPIVPPNERLLYAHAISLYAAGLTIEGDDYLHQAYDRLQLVLAHTQNPEYRRSIQEESSINRQIIAEVARRNLA
jgi:predicted ATPase